MNYERIYNELISSRRDNIPEGYIERHHIIPKCLGGSNDSLNIVALTAREHYIAHKLLWKMNPENNSLLYAIAAMIFMKNKNQKRIKVSSNEYDKIKTKLSIIRSEKYSGKNHPRFGNKNSKDMRNKISLARKGKLVGKENPNYEGKSVTEETRRKMSECSKKRNSKGNHPRAKPLIVSDKFYACINDAVEDLKISNKTIKKRIKDDKYVNYYWCKNA